MKLKPGPGAAVVDKTRMDAFYNTDLEVLIRGISATRLVVTGIVTNACVETTTRSAAMRDLDVVIFENCCTTYSAEHQANALEALEFYRFAEVESWSGAVSRPKSLRELTGAATLASPRTVRVAFSEHAKYESDGPVDLSCLCSVKAAREVAQPAGVNRTHLVNEH